MCTDGPPGGTSESEGPASPRVVCSTVVVTGQRHTQHRPSKHATCRTIRTTRERPAAATYCMCVAYEQLLRRNHTKQPGKNDHSPNRALICTHRLPPPSIHTLSRTRTRTRPNPCTRTPPSYLPPPPGVGSLCATHTHLPVIHTARPGGRWGRPSGIAQFNRGPAQHRTAPSSASVPPHCELARNRVLPGVAAHPPFSPLLHRVEVHTIRLSLPQPLPRAKSSSSSGLVHKRAPTAAHTLAALACVTSDR